MQPAFFILSRAQPTRVARASALAKRQALRLAAGLEAPFRFDDTDQYPRQLKRRLHLRAGL